MTFVGPMSDRETRLASAASFNNMSISYAPNERVLCYHGPLIYEAKVLKAENWDETTTKLGTTGHHYYVHYKGWKQTSVIYLCDPVMFKFLIHIEHNIDGTNGPLLHVF